MAEQKRAIRIKLVFKNFGEMRPYLLLAFLLPFISLAQPMRQPDAAQIQLKLKKLNFLGSVLYMAAHPDDENTNVIAYLANDRLATTAYLSLTRGDGGQNLIGPEIRELLGLIRTQELLAARRIDGGQQFFTRAIDFGYSKSADEAFSVWGKEAVLSDAIKVIRQFKPDIIITRFPPDERAGHGHHTASAIVAGLAFDLAARTDVFPGQIDQFGTWQVKRLYTNTGRWWNRTINEDTPGVITMDVGGYNALLGRSYSEISALSSSQHKSQGWGRRGERGYKPEFLEHVKGAHASENIFEGIDTTWSRVPGGKKVEALVKQAIAAFDARDPAATVPLLFQIRRAIKGLQNSVWRERKLQETDQLIADCLGFYAEVTADNFQCAPGEKLTASVELVNRSSLSIRLQSMRSEALAWDSTSAYVLEKNNPKVITVRHSLPDDATFSGPYWLKYPHGAGLYTVKNERMIGRAETPPAVVFSFELAVGSDTLTMDRPLIYKWVDPVKGELWRPFEIVPPVTVNLSEDVMVFGSEASKTLTMLVKSSSDEMQRGTVSLKLPSGWRAEPASSSFALNARGEEVATTITIVPSTEPQTGVIEATAVVNGKEYNNAIHIISYDHFPIQTLLPPAQTKAVRIDLAKAGQTIGYISGAGDEIPAALRNMGYQVIELSNDQITPARLQGLDAVVLGVRALNTNDRARFFMPAVLDYVANGGTVVVQYNTNARMQTDNFSPYPLTIGRERVTDESAPVKILRPDHPLINKPNKITEADFNGWVQERGLYFPSQWDENFEPILGMNDPGETQKTGGLLVAKYGKGYYIYTGLSFFRQLPEGVPGAFKLFANLVSLGQLQNDVSSGKKGRSK